MIQLMSMLTLPGLIDPHVHLRDPGQTEKEDFFTGTAAALAGGFTTVLDMPNNKVPVTTAERLEEKIKSAREKVVCDVGFYFGSMGENLAEFAKISSKVMGLKLYLNHTTGDFLINHKPTLLRTFVEFTDKKPILFHAENETFDTVLDILREHPRPIHLCHLSTSYELKRVIEAKKKGLPVTCGVTPHHLFLTKEDETSLGTLGMMKPPLQSLRDLDFLWKHLDVIDVIESDHAPHLLSEKQSDTPFFGVPGLETTLPLLLTAVNDKLFNRAQGKLTIDDIIRLCHTNPARIFHIQVDPETKTEVDLDEEWTVENKNLLTKCKWSPFDGWKMRGRVKKVFLRGKKVFEDGNLLAKPGSGKIVTSQT
ncbi:MAG: amidohydrolase family protein [bacterium]|nr:amidohydrolase family protein [bacterium]